MIFKLNAIVFKSGYFAICLMLIFEVVLLLYQFYNSGFAIDAHLGKIHAFGQAQPVGIDAVHIATGVLVAVEYGGYFFANYIV